MANVAVQAKAQDINFVTKFTSDLHNLLAVLGKVEVQTMAPGTAYKVYKTTGTLSTTTVAPKALIPDSNIGTDEGEIVTLDYGKFRNLTAIEEVQKKGYDVAVGASNTALLREIQKDIRKSIFTGVAKGTGNAKGKTFQSRIANAAAYIQTKFEDEACTPIMFANPEDAFGYLGTHTVTLESMFGLKYLSNFIGIGDVIIDSNVPKGIIYGTATENLDVVAASIAEIPGMELTTDETGIIAVHNSAKYENAALETVAYTGLKVLPIYADRIVKTITEA
nr:MAG TPA: major capsid protein [Caudoviricetes sp.]